jgi:hypothetical protein
MNQLERRIQFLANVLVGGTGVVYAAMRYLMQPADEWAVINHPWQPHVQHLHILVAPLLVFACGLVWRRHIAANWANSERRHFSGHGLVLMLIPMVVSGYLIQTTVTDGWRQAWIIVHLVASGAWLFAALGHVALPYLLRGRNLVPTPVSAVRVSSAEDQED